MRLELIEKFFRIYYEIRRKVRHRLLKNKDISIITNNCLGGKLAHDFGLQINSPMVNMRMTTGDFVEFFSKQDEYLKQEFIDAGNISDACKSAFRKVGGGDIDFPVAMIGNIHLYLQHYESFEVAKEAWERRKKRVKDKKFYVLVTKLQDNENVIEKFNKVPVDNKLVLLIDNLYQGELQQCRYMCLGVPKGIHFMDRKGFHYCYDKFSFLKWFNEE